MEEESQLRRAVLEHPADDAPRRAYAAWCEAHGQSARAAFIRAQLERAKLPPDSPEAAHWFQEEMRALRARPPTQPWWALYEAIVARYRARTGKQRTSLSFRDQRGFIAGVGGDVAEVVEVLEELAAIEPIDHVWLEWPGRSGGAASLLPRLAAMPLWVRIKEISLNASAELLHSLGHSPQVAGVRRLSLWANAPDNQTLDTPAILTALIAALAGGFAGVTHFEIRGVALGPAGLEPLCARTLARGKWERLSIADAALGDAGAQLLAAAPGLEHLQALALRDNGVTAAGVSALVNAPGLAALEDLDLGKNLIDEPGMRALQQRRGLPRLRRLGIQECVREALEEEWTEWTGASLGRGKTLRVMPPDAVAARFPLPGATLY